MKKKKIEIDVGTDPHWTLVEWKQFIADMIVEHGKQSIMYTDGHYNNVDLIVKKCQD